MSEIAPIRRHVQVRASTESAFAIFTAHIAAWWPIGGHSIYGEGALVAFEGDRLVERSGDTMSVWAEVLEWDPPRSLRLAWHPGRAVDQATDVRVSFSPEDGMTLVTLEHSGWERVDDPEGTAREYGKGWPRVLDRFGDRVSAFGPASVAAQPTAVPAGETQPAGSEQAGTEQAGTEQAGTERAGTEQAGIELAGIELAGSELAGSELAGSELAGIEQAGVGQAGIELAGLEQAGSELAGLEQAGIEQAGLEQAGLEQAGLEQAGLEQAGLEQAGIEQAGIEQAGLEQAGIEQAGIEQAGVGQAGVGQAGTELAGLEQAGIELAGTELVGIEHADIPGADAKEPTAQWFALVHTPGPLGADESVFADLMFSEHVAFLERLRKSGLLIAAGPIAAERGEGMTVVKVGHDQSDVDIVELATQDDLSVVGGLLVVDIRPWDVRFNS